ncbi:MAG: hypothetical protein LBP73_04215 [Clostridiales Family XIII bacterium]|nr:hypothetical protein [Clostridiales Family XIII bacterium]
MEAEAETLPELEQLLMGMPRDFPKIPPAREELASSKVADVEEDAETLPELWQLLKLTGISISAYPQIPPARDTEAFED